MITMMKKLLHYLLVLIVKVDRYLRRQKITIVNKSSLYALKDLSGPIIFAPTHCGKFDIQVMTEVLWKYRWSLLSGDPNNLPGTVEGYWLKCNGVVYVDRDDKKSRKNAKQKVIDLLRNGENIMLYPEGTWNFSPNRPVLPLYRGVADIAFSANATIIPFGLEIDDMDNTYFVMVGEPIVASKNHLETLENLRDQMATLKWLLYEQHPNGRAVYDKVSLTVEWDKYVEKRLSECSYMDFDLIWKYSRKEPWQIERAQILNCTKKL